MGILSANELKSLKKGRHLFFLTCYDYQTALWMNDTALDGVLVGDSLSQVLYGLDHTSEISMDIMIAHTQAVRKGLKSKHLMADMPSYVSGLVPEKDKGNNIQKEIESEIVSRAFKFRDVGADSIKIENPSSSLVEKILRAGIPVCGHVGLTPQTIHDFKKQGKDDESAQKIFNDALRLDSLGCFALVLEAIPDELALRITESVSAITIGIAAGKKTDAQILVHYDLLGLTYVPKKFVHPQATWGKELLQAVENYIRDGKK